MPPKDNLQPRDDAPKPAGRELRAQRIREARREEIVAAAGRVFTRLGYERAKISDIAAEAGFSHGLVYHYFASKADVFGAIADAMIARLDADMDGQSGRAYERIVRGLERHHGRMCEQVDEQRVVMQAALQGAIPPEVHERLFAHFSVVFSRLCDWVAEAQADGDIDDAVPAEEIVATLVSAVRGMSLRIPSMPELPFQPPRLESIVALLLPRPRQKKHPRTPKSAPRSKGAREVTVHASPKRR